VIPSGEGTKAVKVLKADETASSNEVPTIERLASLRTDHPERNYSRHLASHFLLNGPRWSSQMLSDGNGWAKSHGRPRRDHPTDGTDEEKGDRMESPGY
jgi:hypothetical protein